MKKIILVLLTTFLISCSGDDDTNILSGTELETAIIEKKEKLMGKWNFDSNGSASRSIATCKMNWIEFNPNRKFIFKLKVTGGKSSVRFISGYYHVTYKDPTADGVEFDKIMLFLDDVSNEYAQQQEGGDIATLSNYTFNIANLGSYEVGADFTFKPEERLLGEYCATTPQELSAFQEPLNITEVPAAESNMGKIAKLWRYTEAQSYDYDSPLNYGEGTNGLCVFYYDETKNLCINSGVPSQNCEFAQNQIREATLRITNYGSYIITFYNDGITGGGSGYNNPVSYFDGTWRRYGEPNSEGEYTQFKIIETDKLIAAESNIAKADAWSMYGVVQTLDGVNENMMFFTAPFTLEPSNPMMSTKFVMTNENVYLNGKAYLMNSCSAFVFD